MDLPHDSIRPPENPSLFYHRWNKFVKAVEAAGVFDPPAAQDDVPVARLSSIAEVRESRAHDSPVVKDKVPAARQSSTAELREFRAHDSVLRRRPRKLQ